MIANTGQPKFAPIGRYALVAAGPSEIRRSVLIKHAMPKNTMAKLP
jgi:hypothetical protein